MADEEVVYSIQQRHDLPGLPNEKKNEKDQYVPWPC